MFRQRWPVLLITFLVLSGGAVALIGVMRRPVCQTDDGCASITLTAAIILAGLLTVALNWLISLHQTRQLTPLRTAIERLRQGNPEPLAVAGPDDETNRLIRAFNRLAKEEQGRLRQLESDRERLYSILNSMTDGVLFTDENGLIVFVNPSGDRLLAIRRAQVIGRPFAEIARHHQLIDLWHQCQNEGRAQTAMIQMARRDLFLQAAIAPIAAADAGGFLVILQDLTRIRRADIARRDLISNVSHEFRTPLASLRAVVETLQDGALEDPPAARHFLERAQIEVDTLTQIVEELLTLSGIESGLVPVRLQPVDAAAFVLKAAERLVTQANRNQIDLVVDLPGGLPPVLADEAQVTQVVNNLVHNAIKFTASGGTITLSAKVDDDFVTFAVRDDGEGIPADDLPRIFERFYKADRARRRGVGGTGLGLAIAKHIVQSHGGEIWAKSKEGKGSTFLFTVPTANVSHTIPVDP